MSKGKELKKLLDKGSAIQKEMDAIFSRYEVKYLDLASLPEEARDEWNQLFDKKNMISNQIGDLFK